MKILSQLKYQSTLKSQKVFIHISNNLHLEINIIDFDFFFNFKNWKTPEIE